MIRSTMFVGFSLFCLFLSGCDFGSPTTKTQSPHIVGEGVDGEIIRLSDFKGKVVLVDFWATWCGPCKALEPRERALKQMYKDRPFEILGVALDSKDRLKSYLEKNPLPWPNIVDGSQSLSKQFDVAAVPTFMLIDAQGNLIKTWTGGQNFDQIERAIEKALNELN